MDTKQPYVIDCNGLKSGSYDFQFKVGSELFEIEHSDDILGGDFDVQVQMRKSGSFAELIVAIDGSAVVECDRCLEECRVPVSSHSTLAVRFADGEPDYDGETLYVPAAEPQIDLAHYIYESIVLALPYRRVHPDGECNPEMLARIAGTDCGDENQESDDDDFDNEE